jgi:phosphoserine aminotransferase
MNVVFRLADGNEELEALFAKEAAAEGIVGIVGHRAVGGMRVSLYNAVAIEAVETLVSFMQQFEHNRT